MFSTLGLAACDGGGSGSGGGGSASGPSRHPTSPATFPRATSTTRQSTPRRSKAEITFQTQGLQNDFGDFFKAKIKEFEDANPGVKINWTDQGGGAEFDQTVTAQASNCKMADVINVLPPPSSPCPSPTSSWTTTSRPPASAISS